jgi:hypothetical protein
VVQTAELKVAFGVGVRVEGDVVVLQGDQVTRLVAWLARWAPQARAG